VYRYVFLVHNNKGIRIYAPASNHNNKGMRIYTPASAHNNKGIRIYTPDSAHKLLWAESGV
jgi:hypothetical protein